MDKLQKYLILTIGGLALTSCTRTVYVPTERTIYHSDTLRRTEMRVDSVVERDSVVIEMSGDTVYKTMWRERLRWRDRRDTVYKYVTDTARVEEPLPVERELTRWERAKMELGGLAMGALAIGIVAVGVWTWRRIRR